LVLGSGRKAGVVVSAFLILFFSYGHVFTLMQRVVEGQLGGNLGHEYLLLVWAILFMLYACVAITSAHPEKWTSILNIIAISVIATSVIRVGRYELRAKRINRSSKAGAAEYAEVNPSEEGKEDRPDIYYIVLDQYGSLSTLQKHFDFDNSQFTDYLTSKGFYIASEARANYPRTFQSLASSLNMKHLTYLTDELGKDSSDQTVVYEMLQDYEIMQFLRSMGYTSMHFGSWWEPTRCNNYADVNFSMYPQEFSWMLYRTTILDPIGVKLDILDPRRMQQQLILRKFDELAEVPHAQGPKLVFAHILLPHEPFLFGPQGEMLTQEQVEARTDTENYLNQLAFANGKVKWLIDQILSESDRPPIIVLQADEGPLAGLHEFGEGIPWGELSNETLSAHMRIFSAYYLPDTDYETVLYPPVTPVNSFRIIFDHYFGTNYGLLEDKSFVFGDPGRPYSFIDVTDRVEYP
ncbi:MAG: hypothetical protein ACOC6F_03920, partial [bacterium]